MVPNDFKSVNIMNSKQINLGTIHRTNNNDEQGDNYFLTIDNKKIMGHKEERGWSIYDVSDDGYSTTGIDDNSTRAKNLKLLFSEARATLRSGKEKQRATFLYPAQVR